MTSRRWSAAGRSGLTRPRAEPQRGKGHGAGGRGHRGRAAACAWTGARCRRASYQGRLEVSVYSTDRLRVVRGPMRERRQYLDREAAALWPAYRQALREYERVLLQRNAALQRRGGDLAAWDERLCAVGARVRHRRACYVQRLQAPRHRLLAARRALRDRGRARPPRRRRGGARDGAARRGRRAQGERVPGGAQPGRPPSRPGGPHRGRPRRGAFASSGQARSLLLALALASLEVYRAELGSAGGGAPGRSRLRAGRGARGGAVRRGGPPGQALVTTAHAGWARRLGTAGRLFAVEDGRVRAA